MLSERPTVSPNCPSENSHALCGNCFRICKGSHASSASRAVWTSPQHYYTSTPVPMLEHPNHPFSRHFSLLSSAPDRFRWLLQRQPGGKAQWIVEEDMQWQTMRRFGLELLEARALRAFPSLLLPDLLASLLALLDHLRCPGAGQRARAQRPPDGLRHLG